MRKFLLFLSNFTLLLLATASGVMAGVDPVVIKVLDGSIGQLKKDSVVMVEDAKFFDPFYYGKLIKPYPLKNVISLEINENALFVLQSPFTATVRLRIAYVRNDSTSHSFEENFTVNYDPAGSYNQKRIYALENAARVTVTVLDTIKTVSWNVWQVLKVVNQLQSFPQYNFSCTANAIQSINDSAWAVDTDKDELPVYWAPSLGADEYDLEWCYIDSGALTSGKYGSAGNPDANLLFEHNATRVTITGTYYRIPILYDNKGHLFFRVRPVQWQTGGGRNEANWSSQFVPNGLGRFDFNGHERKLNWQAITSFAEDGKRKVVVNYFDGSLRVRQSVTKDNSTNTTIVSEKFYDHQGRAVIEVLPAPTLNNIIKYSKNFNVGLNSSIYDKYNYDSLGDPLLYCNSGAAPMDTVSGASQYYSHNNPLVNSGVHRYIPDAEGYPFTEVELAPDNTGRITRQSGLGKAFRIGSGHETKYFYGTPDQRELDALFGTEAGHYSHYFKIMERDANGQYNISYMDMRGQTVATALAGLLPDSIKMETLPSYTAVTRTENLSDPASVVIKDLVMESKKGLLVAKAGTHTFTYKLDTLSLRKEGCNTAMVCYDCLYDLEITITDDCNNQKLGGSPYNTVFRNFSIGAIDTTCANGPGGFTINFELFLVEGSYEITKKLSVSRYGMDYYRDSVFLAKNTCKKIESFLAEQRQFWAGIQQCKPTCDSCKANLGTWTEFWTRFRQQSGIANEDTALFKDQAFAAYEAAAEDCRELCDSATEANDVRKSMLMDMMPSSGQYANVDNLDPWSVFYSDLDDEAGADTVAIYRRDEITYLDENGQQAMVFDEGAGMLVKPGQLSPELFVQKFQVSWANALLPYHPEYCKLLRYDTLRASHEWDRRFAAVNTYAEAVAKGYLNPIGEASFPARFFGTTNIDRDPLRTLQGGIFYNSLRDSIEEYRHINTVGDISMWGAATVSVKCQDAANVSNCYSFYGSTANAFNTDSLCVGELDMAWRIYRQMYLDIKRNIINTHWIKPGCTTSLTAAQIMAAGHQPHFSDARELLSAAGTDLPDNLDEANAFKNQHEGSVNSFYANNCQAYATLWWQQLKPCNFNPLDSAYIISRLIEVCKEGADANHPVGASSVRPSSSHRFRSFRDALQQYADSVLKIFNNNACNPLLITDPPPYDRPKAFGNNDVWNKPDSCQCTTITNLHLKYQSNSGGAANFAQYVQNKYDATMTEQDLQTLLGLCNNTITCEYLPAPITIPAQLQCGSELACITCKEMAAVYSQFLHDYSGNQRVIPNDTNSRQDYYNLLTNYFNAKLGFKKQYHEYEAFLQQCSIPYFTPSNSAPLLPGAVLNTPATGNATVESVSCDTLQDILSDFSALYPNPSKWNLVTRKRKGVFTTSVEYLLACSGILKPWPPARVYYPPKWIGSGLRDSGFSSMWYRNNLTFVKFDFSRFPSKAFVDSINLKISPVLTDSFQTDINWCAMSTTWDTSLRCSQLGSAFNGFQVPTYTPLYQYQTAQSNPVYVYDCKTQLTNFVKFNNGNWGNVLTSHMNPANSPGNSASFIGTNSTEVQSDPERRPRIDIYYRVDTIYECNDLITAYFNYRLNSNLTHSNLLALYQQKCGVALTVNCNTNEQGFKLCGRSKPVFPAIQLDQVDNCSDSSFFIASVATEQFNAYSDSLKNNFDSSYRARCLEAYKLEKFTVRREISEYHYTLYYYDQAGNLIKTIPPEGVHPNYDSLWLDSVYVARMAGQVKLPIHTLATEYRYNSLKMVIAQRSPDGGKSQFWYDRLGRLAISQNARQKAAAAAEAGRKYTYTLFDDIGRIMETGEISNGTANSMHDSISRSSAKLADWLTSSAAGKSQIAQNIYDIPYAGFAISPNPIVQRNLRNRVSFTTFTLSSNAARYNHGTFYSYDAHGNADTVLQDYGNSSFAEVQNVMNANSNRFKKIAYQFDLIRNKVKLVAYQAKKPDQYYQRYSYDADDKLIIAESSTDSLIWEKDARYEYYRHGPLARMVIGDQQVQGLDHAYTIQGWLKGINSASLNADFDMGTDGKPGGLHQYVARDAMGLQLNYFGADYKAISSHAAFPTYSAFLNTAYRPLYNSNISSMLVNIGALNNPLFYNYTYDQLNRIKGMDAYTGLNQANNSFSGGMNMLPDYKERINYDENGNILNYLRNGFGSNLVMDSLTYNYNRDVQGRLIDNKLNFVRDRLNNSTAHAGNYTEDVEDQAAGNYTYDAIGNLTTDNQEGITNITWNVYGKISEIQRTANAANPVTNLQYMYDGAGRRIGKRVAYISGTVEYTWYVRDGAGQLLAVYKSTGTGGNFSNYDLKVAEQHLYGTARLGIINRNADVKGVYVPVNPDSMMRGNKHYELSNYLGNVLVTVSDKKTGTDAGTLDGLVDYYVADILSATDYYPFGMSMPGRVTNAGDYRFGFNGKEFDWEAKGWQNQYDYGFRIYDPRIGKFLSVDPLTRSYPMLTPYQFASNRPIDGIDLDGKEFYKKNISYDVRSGKFGITVGYKVNLYSTATHVNVNLPDVASKFKDQFKFAFQGVYDSRRNISYSADAVVTIDQANAPMNIEIDEAKPMGVHSITGKRLYGTGLTAEFNTQENNVASSAALMDESETCVVKVLSNEQIANTGVHESLHTGQVFHPFDEQNTAEDVDLEHTGAFKNKDGIIRQNYRPSRGADILLISTNVMMYPSITVNGSPIINRISDALKLNKISPDQAYQLVKSISNDSGEQYEKNKGKKQ